MVADAEGQLLADRSRSGQRAIMGGDQRASIVLKGRAIGGQANRAGRALDQPLSKRGLEALELHADGRLRRTKGFGGAGEALQFSHQQEGLNCRNIECVHFIIMYRYD